MNLIALLTSWNRPELLAQSLPQILVQCAEMRIPLVIADDQSSRPETISLLMQAQVKGADVTQRPYLRDGSQTRHELTGLNAFYAFNYVLQKYPDATHILKLDDDIFLADRAFRRILDTYSVAVADGHEVLATSGIQTKNEQTRETFDGGGLKYNTTTSPCAACTLYAREDIFISFNEKSFPASVHQINGWDWTLWENYGRKFKPKAVAIATNPSVCFHTGNKSGTHVRDEGINVNFCGNKEGIIEA